MLTVAGKKPHVYADFHCSCQQRVVAIEGYEDFQLKDYDGLPSVKIRCPGCGHLHIVPATPKPASAQ